MERIRQINTIPLGLKPALWTLVSFLVAWLSFTFVYDDSYDGITNNMSVGQFSDFSLMDWHYLGIIWIKEVFMFLQDCLPKLNVFYSLCIFFNLLALYYLYHSFYRVTAAWGNWSIALMEVVFCLVGIDNLIFITHTRFATILAGVALFNLGYHQQQSRKELLFHACVFLFGFLARPESGMGALVVVLPGLFLGGIPWTRLLKLASLPIACSLLFFLSLWTHQQFTNRLEILMEPDVEYAMSLDKFKPLSNDAGTLDSMRYVFARNAFFIDTAFTNIHYFRSIISHESDFELSSYLASARHVLGFYKAYLFGTLIWLVLGLFSFSRPLTRQFLNWMLYHAWVFLVFILVDNQVNLSERHFTGLFLSAILVSSIFFTPKNNLLVLGILLLPGWYGFQHTWGYIQQNNQFVKSRVERNVKSLNTLEKQIQGKTIVVAISGFKLFDKPYSPLATNRNKNRYLLYDLSTYSIVPRYTGFLNQTCHCVSTNPLSFFTWLNQTDSYLLIAESRSHVLERYFKVRFGKNLELVDVLPPGDFLNTGDYPDLRLKRVEWKDSLPHSTGLQQTP
ncbi:MAG: hypothetical protein K1X82_14360 [Bacteroidia bacterium]|nr:hypothetical protein [Bacteroidia bacterium]